MRRVVLVIAMAALMPFVMGAGGGAPGIPFGTKVAGTTYKASVVLDPHNTGVTTTAKEGSIRLFRDPHLASALFTLPAIGFPLAHGCDPSLTNTRFLNVPLIQWIPENVLDELFASLGDPRSPTKEPVITRIEQVTCTEDANNPTTGDGSAPGILSFQADVRFLVPK